MATPPQRYHLVSRQSDDDWTTHWFHQIGWVGYFFAQLEWCTFWLAEAIGSEEQKREMCNKKFVERCRYAKRVLVSQLDDSLLRNDWAVFLDEVAKTGPMRNKILHNPLNVTVNEIATQGVTIEKGIRLLRDRGGKIIELSDVQCFSENIRKLNNEMLVLMERTKN